MSVHRLAWLWNSGSFACSRRLAASKALKRFNGDHLLYRRTNVLGLGMNEPSAPVFGAYSIRVG